MANAISFCAVSWTSHQGLVCARFITQTSCTCASVESESCCSGLWHLLCQKSCPLIADVSLHGKDQANDRLGHWQVNSNCWALGPHLLGLCLLDGFFPLMLLRSPFLHVAHPFRMRSVWGGCYICHGSVFAVFVSSSQPHAVQLTRSDVCSL